ncbi:MAG: GerMN domain-containing protein [Clostridia bacterium]|nr:GerMN domain-containing protein [Clostridia bacterium]
MNKNLFSDGLAHIDVDAVERMLRIDAELERKRARRRFAWVKPVLIAAALALLLSTVLVIVPFIPKTLDIEYEPSKGLPENVWVYYVNDNGTQKRERVSLPGGAANVFEAWKYLNEVDNAVEILNYEETVMDQMISTVVPNTLWEYLQQKLSLENGQKTVTVTLSAQITSYENYDALIESLIDTLAKYAGVDPEQVKILIDGEQVAVVGGLQFYHSLQGGAPVMSVPGSTLEITVGMTNISDRDIEFTGSWSAFVPNAMLTMSDTCIILHEDYPITEEYQKYVLAPGESREMTYTFHIPEQATCGEYDLVVSFGEHSFTFEKAVHVVGFGYVPSPSVSATEFHEFLIKYGFVTTDPEAFRASVGALTYHSGKGMFDIMTPADIEYEEGYSGEEYGSDLFAYGYTRSPDGSCNNFYLGAAIPDDMRLPHAIAPGDTLYTSLCKMGLGADSAQETVARAQKLFEGEQLMLGNEFFTFCITRNSYGEYIILYSFTAAPVDGDPAPPEYSIELIYSEANMTFQVFRVKAGYGEFSTDAFAAPIKVTPYNLSYVSRELSEEDTQTLLAILNNGSWRQDSIELDCEYQITFAGKAYRYSAEAGVFVGNGHFLPLTEEQRRTVNEIITVGNYQPSFSSVKLSDSNKIVSLPASVELKIKKALNDAEWRDGTLELAGMLDFNCDGTFVGYSDGTFFTTTHYWYADGYTKDITDALHEAIVGLHSEEYDSIIYYADTYFGHNEAVDEKLNGTFDFSMNINPQRLEDMWCAHNGQQTVSMLGDIVDCSKADQGVLVTVNGTYFEQITEFDPDFGSGTVVLTPYAGSPVEIRDEDAQMLREIFQRAEFSYCFGDHEAVYETRIEIGSYTIEYLSAWGDAKIGDWKATLSEEDRATVAEIIGGYVNVE